MKRLLLACLLMCGSAMAQAPFPTQPEPPGPVKIPDAPQLPYHFAPRVVAPLGEKFGNVAAITIMKNGDLLVFNRNPDIMMVEYDPSGTTVKRVFNPNIAMNPHALRIDRHGNIWASDSFLNVIFKMNDKGEVLKVFGVRGENGPWNDAKWNGMFNQPLDIAFDKDDNFYVVQSHGGTSPPADCSFCATMKIPQVEKVPHHAVYVNPPVVRAAIRAS